MEYHNGGMLYYQGFPAYANFLQGNEMEEIQRRHCPLIEVYVKDYSRHLGISEIEFTRISSVIIDYVRQDRIDTNSRGR